MTSGPGQGKPSELVIARLHERSQPMERGERYEEPLQEWLVARGWGEVCGGGSQFSENGEIEHSEIELSLTAAAPAMLRVIAEQLEQLGAPRGSAILGEPELPFGRNEGIAIYLNGSELPDSTYAKCDLDFVVEECDRLLAGIGGVHGHWQGQTETALYVYGPSADSMQAALQPLLDGYPLCERARLVRVA